jgi:hypothetical protein
MNDVLRNCHMDHWRLLSEPLACGRIGHSSCRESLHSFSALLQKPESTMLMVTR